MQWEGRCTIIQDHDISNPYAWILIFKNSLSPKSLQCCTVKTIWFLKKSLDLFSTIISEFLLNELVKQRFYKGEPSFSNRLYIWCSKPMFTKVHLCKWKYRLLKTWQHNGKRRGGPGAGVFILSSLLKKTPMYLLIFLLHFLTEGFYLWKGWLSSIEYEQECVSTAKENLYLVGKTNQSQYIMNKYSINSSVG